MLDRCVEETRQLRQGVSRRREFIEGRIQISLDIINQEEVGGKGEGVDTEGATEMGERLILSEDRQIERGEDKREVGREGDGREEKEGIQASIRVGVPPIDTRKMKIGCIHNEDKREVEKRGLKNVRREKDREEEGIVDYSLAGGFKNTQVRNERKTKNGEKGVTERGGEGKKGRGNIVVKGREQVRQSPLGGQDRTQRKSIIVDEVGGGNRERVNECSSRQNDIEEREYNGVEVEEGELGELQSEDSSLDLVDRQMLESCLQQRIEEQRSEEERSGKDSVRDRGEEETLIREGVTMGSRVKISEKGDTKNHRGYRIEEHTKEGGELALEIQSDISSIDLVDRDMLQRCIEQNEEIREKKRAEEEGRRQETQSRILGDGGNKGLEEGRVFRVDMARMQSRKDDSIRKLGDELADRRNGSEEGRMTISKMLGLGMEDGVRGTNTEESSGTTGSIAALFVDKHLEREGKKIGSKNVTRRMVWEKWKGVVRGAIRRGIRRRNRVTKGAERQEEDRKIVFDYTTKGLSVEEFKLLGKGELFCVVDYKIDEDRNRVDIYQYQRRLRLHEVFRDPGGREEDRIEEICTPVVGSRNRVRGQDRERDNDTERRTTRGGRDSIISTRGRGEGSISRRIQNINRRESVVVRGQNNLRYNSDSRRGGRTEDTQVRGGRESRVSIRGRGDRGVVSRVTQDTEAIALRITDAQGRRNSMVSTRGRGIGRGGTQSSRGSIATREGVEIREKEGRRLPSIYDPDSQNRNLHRYNTCIQEEISLAMEDKKVQFRDNITKEERKALKSLKRRIEEKEIVVTRADKGSGLVAVDYDKYIDKGTKYIEEEAGAYSRVQEAEQVIIGRLTKERNKIADQLREKGVIEGQTATYVKKQLEEKITGIKFYYKIHKDRRIDSMPLRPLQSCIKAPMQHLSIVLTDILQPLLTDRNIPSFIFDSNQLLYRLSKLGQIPGDCTLISSDVSALYPSIPHEAGFIAMKGFLEEKTTYNEQQIESLIKALELVITENYMTWNRQIYKQVSGVAMGTPVAVAYANIFINWVDIEVRKKAPYIYEHIRYIDDNLFILPGDRVEQLMQIANSILPPDIKFTYEKLEVKSGKGLPFLDTQLFIGIDINIESRLYTKATDRHAYLLPASYHPPHITRNIPLAVFGRPRKICSREEWFEEDEKKAEGWLENRGYKRDDIQKALAKTRLKDRWGMIEQIEKNRVKDVQKKEEIVTDIPFILTYNQHVKKIRQILKDRQPLLDSAFKRTKVRPRLSYRRKRNLNDIVVQKGLKGPIEDNRKERNIFSQCGEKPGYRSRCPCRGKHRQEACRCCMHSVNIIEGIECKLYKPVDCNSRNVVYIIEYRECRKRYVGETQQRLKDRLAQYMYNIDKLNQPLYLHFRLAHKLENLGIGIVETVRGVEPFMRKVREVWWINQLKTLEPSGFNVKLE